MKTDDLIKLCEPMVGRPMPVAGEFQTGQMAGKHFGNWPDVASWWRDAAENLAEKNSTLRWGVDEANKILGEVVAERDQLAERLKAAKKLVDLAASTMIVHRKKTCFKAAIVDDELANWSIDGGCEADCPGCAKEKQRDAALAAWRATT